MEIAPLVLTEYTRLIMDAHMRTVSPKKVEQAAQVLQKSVSNPASLPEAERRDILRLLGPTHAVQHRQLIKSFLEYTDDPWTVRCALEALDLWGDTWKYTEIVYSFLSAVPWDELQIVRSGAIQIAGEYLRTGHDTRMLRRLIEITEDEAEDGEARGIAYNALLAALDTPPKRIPAVNASRPLAHIKPSTLDEARQLVQYEEDV